MYNLAKNSEIKLTWLPGWYVINTVANEHMRMQRWDFGKKKINPGERD